MGQLSLIDQQTGQPTRWSPPSLSDKLCALLANYSSLTTAPVIGPKSAAELQAFVDACSAPPMPGREDVEKMLALLASVKRRRQNSAVEAGAQLEQYWQGLKTVPLDDLRHAYDVLLKSSPWFPDISEIRAAATSGPVAKLQRNIGIARALIMKHRQEYVAPVEPVTPEQAKEIRAMVEALGKGSTA